MCDTFFSNLNSNNMIKALIQRRSVAVTSLEEPGPSEEELRVMLTAAARVPDHGKLCPWYFLVFQGEARHEVGSILKQAYMDKDPKASHEKLKLETARFLRAPVVVGVISKIREGKHPIWEQILSAGASAQNLCLAANALGYATNWITEWYSYNNIFCSKLGLSENEHIAGFIYIGTASMAPKERERPELEQIVTYWKPGTIINKGPLYGRKGMGIPHKGFSFKTKNNAK